MQRRGDPDLVMHPETTSCPVLPNNTINLHLHHHRHTLIPTPTHSVPPHLLTHTPLYTQPAHMHLYIPHTGIHHEYILPTHPTPHAYTSHTYLYSIYTYLYPSTHTCIPYIHTHT